MSQLPNWQHQGTNISMQNKQVCQLTSIHVSPPALKALFTLGCSGPCPFVSAKPAQILRLKAAIGLAHPQIKHPQVSSRTGGRRKTRDCTVGGALVHAPVNWPVGLETVGSTVEAFLWISRPVLQTQYTLQLRMDTQSQYIAFATCEWLP
jgi:hypothetical protein